MSRLALGQKSGVVAALAALVLGLTAAAALGWANEGNGNNDKEKEHGNKPPPTATVPPPTQTTPTPVVQPPPATPASPPPVTSQTTPTPHKKVTGGSIPGGNKEKSPSETPQGPVVAETPTAAPLAPVAERKELAETGIDPGLIALLGALCLVGGALLFRRSLARG
jgi:LPXTG-motif cell wall-anchored protein